MENNYFIQEEQERVLSPMEVQDEIKRTRHKEELPLYITCSVLAAIALVGYLAFSDAASDLFKVFEDGITGSNLPDGFGVIMMILGLISGSTMVIMIIVGLLLQMYQLYAGQLSYSVRVSESNFPELYAKVKEYTHLLGLNKEPEVYVQQMNGQVNAFSTWVPGKTYIQMNAEIVDLAYMENKDWDTVCFVLAHEMGHIKLHHVQLLYILLPIFVTYIPVVGPILYMALQRAREYSCDRVAQALTGGKSEVECMMLLGAGRHAYKHLDAARYVEEINRGHNSVERFFRWIMNLSASHPIMPFRTEAILDKSKSSGRLF